MLRMQVQLTETQATALRRLARRRNVSTAAVVREAVDLMLEVDEMAAARERAKAAVGKFASGKTDVSVNHDKYLEEAYLA